MASYLKLIAVQIHLDIAVVLIVVKKSQCSISSHTSLNFDSASLSFSQPASSVAAIHKITPKTMCLCTNSGFQSQSYSSDGKLEC